MNRLKWLGISLILSLLCTASTSMAIDPLVVTDEQNGGSVTLTQGQYMTLNLPGNPSTGYQWKVPNNIEAYLTLHDSSYTPGSDRIGAPGHFTFHFEAQQLGTVNLEMTYARSFETGDADRFSLTVSIVRQSNLEPSTLAGTSWRLAEWSDSSLNPADFQLTAQFSDGNMAGQSAVNQYSCSYTGREDGTFTVGPVRSTMMAGEESARRAEQVFLKLLAQAHHYSLTDGQLVLSNGSNQKLLTYQSVL